MRPIRRIDKDKINFLRQLRRQFARVLRHLPEAAFARRGTHNRRGAITVAGMVEDYVEHVDHHLKFLHEKRARLGKPVTTRN